MQNLEIEALRDLENNIPYDYCRSCDSSDGLYHEWPDEDSWQYRIKMLLEEKDKEIKELEQKEVKYQKEIERLNNVVNRFEKDIFGMYVDIVGCTEDYARKLIEEIKGDGTSGN